MGVVHVLYFTDPFCPWSWALEPALRRLDLAFGGELEIAYVMSGMRLELTDPTQLALQALEASRESGMPVDPRVWLADAPRSSHPACIAVKAAAEQGDPGAYLRRLRESLFCRAAKLDNADALMAEARALGSLDLERFRIDLGSHAILEAFAADLELAGAVAPEHHAPGSDRVELPSFEFRGADGAVHGVYGFAGFDELRSAALGAGANRADPAPETPSIEQALRRFGTMSTAEVAAVCELPGPQAPAALWKLAGEWRVEGQDAGTGELWSLR